MSIEVREVAIKATITQDNEAVGSLASARANNNQSPAEELINTCVEKVLEILKEKNGR